MTAPVHLLPSSSTALERALSEATDAIPKVGAAIASLHGIKLAAPPPSLLPYLVYEYGLGELTPYIANLYELIDEGVAWSRVRGTPDAVDRSLSWLGYAAGIEEAPTRRRRWNLFQLALDRLRDDEADLEPIEGVADLSTSLRSVFWRGFHGYDVRAIDWSRTKWGRNLWGSYSGARIRDGGAKWSFGRGVDIDHAMTEAELTALGVWIPPVDEGGETAWLNIPWPDLPWGGVDEDSRSALMLSAVPDGPAWAVFLDAGGDVIGYRRARINRRVEPAVGGPYLFGGVRYAPVAAGAAILLLEALTDFGDGYGAEAASVAWILSADTADPDAPGALWLGPDELAGDPPRIAPTPVSIPFGQTVRERVTALLRF